MHKQRKNARHTFKNSFLTCSGWVRLLQDAALTDRVLVHYRPSGRTRAGLTDETRRSAGCWYSLGTVFCSQLIAKCLLPKHNKSQQQQLLIPDVILVTLDSVNEFSNIEITEISKKRTKIKLGVQLQPGKRVILSLTCSCLESPASTKG